MQHILVLHQGWRSPGPMGIAGMPSPVGSQTPSDLGSLSAAAFALLGCSPI